MNHNPEKLLMKPKNVVEFLEVWYRRNVGTCTATDYRIIQNPEFLFDTYEIWGVENPEMESELDAYQFEGFKK